MNTFGSTNAADIADTTNTISATTEANATGLTNTNNLVEITGTVDLSFQDFQKLSIMHLRSLLPAVNIPSNFMVEGQNQPLIITDQNNHNMNGPEYELALNVGTNAPVLHIYFNRIAYTHFLSKGYTVFENENGETVVNMVINGEVTDDPQLSRALLNERQLEFENFLTNRINEILQECDIIITNRDINSWGNISERMENVHDSSVNISLRAAYSKIRELNKIDLDNGRGGPLYIQNIRSYYFLYNLRLVDMQMNLTKFGLATVELYQKFLSSDRDTFLDCISSIYKDPNLFISDISAVLNNFKKEIDNLTKQLEKINKCLYVINFIAEQNSFVVAINDNELNVLLEVWRRIHSKSNDSQYQQLIDQFNHEMSLLVNMTKEEKVECVNGRIAAMISTLELFDSDNIVDIKSVPVLKVMMVQNRAPKIIDELVESYKQLGPDNELEVDKYLNNWDNCDSLVDYIRQGLITKLTDEFSDKLSKMHFDRFLSEILNEI